MEQSTDDDADESNRHRAIVDPKMIQRKSLEDFAPPRTQYLIVKLGVPYSFLDVDPSQWLVNEDYLKAKATTENLHVVNGIAERSVALMSEYNNMISCDEDQKQYLLLVVADHRKRFPDSRKKTLAAGE